VPAGADTIERTTCVIAGGGPAGIMLGLVPARGGVDVDVTVMEKHADLLRDVKSRRERRSRTSSCWTSSSTGCGAGTPPGCC